MRASLPAELVAFLDSEAPTDLAADLRVLRDESAERGWGAAVEGMSRSLAATGGVDRVFGNRRVDTLACRLSTFWHWRHRRRR